MVSRSPYYARTLAAASAVLTLIIAALGIPPYAFADCYRDCITAAGCGIAGENSDQTSCSGAQARCSTDCRHGSDDGTYGAIAYSAADEAYGYSHGWDNQKQAEKEALMQCGQHGKNCEVMVWYSRSCGALAADGDKYGWGQNDVKARAEETAKKSCEKSGGKSCEIKTSQCSP